MSQVSITAYDYVYIGNNVMLGADVKIWDTDFHPIDAECRNRGAEGKCKPVFISNNAFVGACSIILKGVTIGENSVIDAGSVVTKDVPPNQIWAGNPAIYRSDI